jgi:hypothetical protein
MKQAVVGIDIGLSGAVAALCTDKTIMLFDMPVLDTDNGKKYNIKRLIEILGTINKGSPIVFVEKAIILPRGFNIKAPTSLAYCEGLLEGLLKSLQIDYRHIHPKTWQAMFKINKTKDSDTKEQAMKIAKELFPQSTLETKRGKQLDGRADALLIAEAGRRILEEESRRIF